MSDSEEEPFQDSGSEYQPSISSGRQSLSDVDDGLTLTDLEYIPVSLNGSNSPANLDVQAASTSIVSDKKTRKRKRSSKNEWKKNIRKILRQSGQKYKSCKGGTASEKRPKRNCVNCRFKCLDNFTENEVLSVNP
uniref:Uncharacterized protein LOC114324265 n=1 Tax=Diabrotica virgifera virgifera TaxID=50390 RepID=A0A6P7F1R6_DIAVI